MFILQGHEQVTRPIEDEFRPPPTEFTRGQRGHLRIEAVSALLSEPEPELKWLIEGLWTDKSRGLIAGHPGVGKTWLALDMLLAVTTGGLCLGKYQAAGPYPSPNKERRQATRKSRQCRSATDPTWQ